MHTVNLPCIYIVDDERHSWYKISGREIVRLFSCECPAQKLPAAYRHETNSLLVFVPLQAPVQPLRYPFMPEGVNEKSPHVIDYRKAELVKHTIRPQNTTGIVSAEIVLASAGTPKPQYIVRMTDPPALLIHASRDLLLSLEQVETRDRNVERFWYQCFDLSNGTQGLPVVAFGALGELTTGRNEYGKMWGDDSSTVCLAKIARRWKKTVVSVLFVRGTLILAPSPQWSYQYQSSNGEVGLVVANPVSGKKLLEQRWGGIDKISGAVVGKTLILSLRFRQQSVLYIGSIGRVNSGWWGTAEISDICIESKWVYIYSRPETLHVWHTEFGYQCSYTLPNLERYTDKNIVSVQNIAQEWWKKKPDTSWLTGSANIRPFLEYLWGNDCPQLIETTLLIHK